MPEKPFFRKFDGWWYIQLRQGHKRFLKNLIKGKENRQQAYELFNQIMAEGADTPPPTACKVSDILRAFLHFSSLNNDERTFAWYKSFLLTFDDLYGSLKPHQDHDRGRRCLAQCPPRVARVPPRGNHRSEASVQLGG